MNAAIPEPGSGPAIPTGTHQGAHAGTPTDTECAEVVLRLLEYVDNEAAEEDCVRIKEHLDACGSCLREYERDVLLKAMVRRACGSQPAPETLRTAILTRITTVTVTRTRSSTPRRPDLEG